MEDPVSYGKPVSNEKLVRDIKHLDQLFLQAAAENTPSSWAIYLEAQSRYKSENTKWNIKISRNQPDILGVKWADALEGSPFWATVETLEKWRKSLHRADAPRDVLIDRYVLLTQIIDNFK